MNLQLEGKHAVISGSTAGIGFAIATVLASEGASVTLNGRTQAAVDAALTKLRGPLNDRRHVQGSRNLHGIAADLGTAAGCSAFVNALGKLGKPVDVLINNLGIFDPKPFESIPDEDWQRFFEVNVMSGVRLTRALLPGMKQRNWGRVIFISSESGICPPAEMVHYGMSKSAQLSIARGLAETCAGTGVTVNSVLPGPTLTEGAKDFFDKLAKAGNQSFDEAARDFFAHARPTSIIKRFITPEEVAATVTYLCSPLAAATTGASVRVDGGVVRSIV
jgi:NAD(P)-dependent dehydrogenase (short-subunit alcohol dehydrogenase family)